MKGGGRWMAAAAAAAGVLMGGVMAASYDDIPDIEAYGQHFFYTNNGSQFFLKGVAYQQNYSPNGSTSASAGFTDPLADAAACARDIPYLKQIYTNIIRVYAIDPSKNHDDCMAQLASADIYVIADLGEPGTSIESNDPQWDVTLYNRYTGVIDALQKYKNVLGFFAGNENVSAGNQTAAAAFVKAAVRDTKGYIQSQGYRSTLGVGYATADVPTRNELAYYFACEPDSTSSSQIDFWGYNVYSWCGDSNYADSSYGERVDFFSDYPVPAFFAEYGCIVGVDGGATNRPFTEVEALYGNMTSVFSGGIAYEWFMGVNEYGLVELTDNDASVSPYPDFTSLMSQLATVSPSTTARSAYTPSNSAPACPTVDSSWAAAASPLPPAPNAQLCTCMLSSLQCAIESSDSDEYEAAFNYICAADTSHCNAIEHNATSGTYGGYSGCDPKDQLAFVANHYYLANGKSKSACDFSGLATVQTASTASSCSSLLSAVGSAGTGTVASPTAKATEPGSATKTTSKGAAPSVDAPGFFQYGGLVFGVYVLTAVGSLVGMLVL